MRLVDDVALVGATRGARVGQREHRRGDDISVRRPVMQEPRVGRGGDVEAVREDDQRVRARRARGARDVRARALAGRRIADVGDDRSRRPPAVRELDRSAALDDADHDQPDAARRGGRRARRERDGEREREGCERPAHRPRHDSRVRGSVRSRALRA